MSGNLSLSATAELRTNGLNVSHSEHKIGEQVPLDGGELWKADARAGRFDIV